MHPSIGVEPLASTPPAGRVIPTPLAAIGAHDLGHGYDVFGMSRGGIATAERLGRFLYRHWFRVSSHGAERIPATGAALLCANHGACLPFDGLMLYLDVLHHTDPPRVARPVGDLFIPHLPWVGTLFARGGVVGGSRENVRRLLADGELLMIFPEGSPGTGKPLRQRYQLAEWRVGHAELAIRHRVPVIPVGIIGPDEAWPALTRLSHLHPFGAPWLPLPAWPLPLPVHVHIHYGEPIDLGARLPSRAADDPELVAAAAARIRDAVAALLARGLAARPGVFR